jgi:hypothetical protein
MRTKMCLIEKKEKKDNKDIVCLLLIVFFLSVTLYGCKYFIQCHNILQFLRLVMYLFR